jgi:hypothetical protein
MIVLTRLCCCDRDVWVENTQPNHNYLTTVCDIINPSQIDRLTQSMDPTLSSLLATTHLLLINLNNLIMPLNIPILKHRIILLREICTPCLPTLICTTRISFLCHLTQLLDTLLSTLEAIFIREHVRSFVWNASIADSHEDGNGIVNSFWLRQE